MKDGLKVFQDLATLLRNLGYKNVSLTASSSDDEMDLLAEDVYGNPLQFFCKVYQNTVAPVQVRAVIEKRDLNMVEDRLNCAVLIALSGVTESAKKFAEMKQVLLWDGVSSSLPSDCPIVIVQ